MNTPEKDCIHRGWIAALALIAVLTAVSFIPPQSLGGVKLRRANILSDLVAFNDAVAAAEEPALFDEEDFHVDMEQVAERMQGHFARLGIGCKMYAGRVSNRGARIVEP